MTGRRRVLAKASIACASVSVLIVVPMAIKNLVVSSQNQINGKSSGSASHPNVAAEPSMYCPNVRIMPLGPGPNLTMLVAPKRNQCQVPCTKESQFDGFAHRI